jgi:BirA family transcriptional regulator, biotin operon repressor / biotin---[acetyl-CoA-carboxylase] ligase
MIGTPHVHYRVTGSTNERAKELAAAGAPHGTLVTADEQSAGRGRQGRAWSAPHRSALLMSLVVRGLEERHGLLPLAAAVAACEGSEEAAAVECRIKWPNDVWVGRRKLAGILIEGRPRDGWAVVGIGLNVATREDDFPEELRQTATSLRIAGGGAPRVTDVRRAVLAALERRIGDPPEEVISAWRARDALRGEAVRWSGGEGVAAGVDDKGGLLVDTLEGRVTLDAGEVHLAPAPRARR